MNTYTFTFILFWVELQQLKVENMIVMFMFSYYHSWSKKFIKNIFQTFISYFCECKCLPSFSIILAYTYCHYRFQFKCCSYALLLFFSSFVHSLNSAISLIHECLFVCLFVCCSLKNIFFYFFFSCLYLKGKK